MGVAGYFPEDLTRDILLRIPVKSISRFRCVHKTWDSLFKSSSFIITHLNNSNKTGHNLMLVIMIPKYVIMDEHSPQFMRFRLFTRDTFNVHLDLEAPFPITSPLISRYPFVGFCNGLVCLHMYTLQPEQIVLYNPCLKQHKIIHPPFGFNVSDDFQDRVLGFGYDSINNDYKVVYWRKRTQAQVYSTLGTKSWRNVDPPDNVTFVNVLENFQAFLNGAIHWWGILGNQKNVVISFNVGREEFRVFPLPDYVPRGKQIGIYVCRDLLCVSMANIFDHLNQCYDIWVMGEYGVQESWTRLFVVNNDKCPNDCSYFTGIGMNGELVWYSRQYYTGRMRVTVNYSDNEESHDIEFDDEDFPLFPVVTYTESLVSLK